jgi:hypothetical protein
VKLLRKNLAREHIQGFSTLDTYGSVNASPTREAHTMTKLTAVEKRYAAIKSTSDRFRPESNGYHLIGSATAEDMIADIEAMRSLGRTDRWQGNLTQWIEMIREYPNNLEWAHLQGAIYAAYAAE